MAEGIAILPAVLGPWTASRRWTALGSAGNGHDLKAAGQHGA